MKPFISCIALVLFLFGQATFAQTAVLKKTAPPSTQDEDDITPDIKGSATFEYHCEMNDALTIYTNLDDNDHIALRWKTHIYRLKRIDTSTGANRYENKKTGLVWIAIPSKGMLLDSRHGQQLANECKTAG